jgi:hypothetical protein
MRNLMLGLAIVALGGVGLNEASAGCPGGRCGAWSYSYSRPVYSSCGPGGCSVPAYRPAPPPAVNGSPSDHAPRASRAPSVQTYGYRPYVTYYRGNVAYTSPRSTVARPAARPQATPVRVAPPPAQPPADLPK